ncbi:hypothetical protein FQA39_LY17781 [Lamprigera yunnana]|nr:hypothetical protein FQA39_LY17781 [Lamprigera yunnana]
MVSAVLLVLHLLLFYNAVAVRISPKLDFGDSSDSSNAHYDVRPTFNPNNYRKLDGEASSRQDVLCSSSDCDVSRKSDTSSASTDVLVHVQTNVNVPNAKNFTEIPDIPIIVGNKDTYSDAVFPSSFDSNYPSHEVGYNVPYNPLEGNRDGFNNYPLSTPAQEVGYNLHYRPLERNGDRFNNYPSNGIFGNTPIERNPYTPDLQWYPRRRPGHVQNPIEFTKIYRNSWTSGFPNDWSGYTNKRHAHSVNEWKPCLCNTPEVVRSY